MLGHDKPVSATSVAPLGFGLLRIDQLVPVQCSLRVRSLVPNAPVLYLPVAKQFVALGHDSALNELEVVPVGFGTVATVHVVPFQCSMSGWVPE